MFVAMAPPEIESAAAPSPYVWQEQHANTAISLDGRPLVFSEEFNGPAALSGPKLFAPVHAPYGAGKFDAPDGPAYSVSGGVLRLKAYKTASGWRSGTVQTVDPKQQGFTCSGCYFETRLKFPHRKTSGFWGAFWLLSNDDPTEGHVEVDVIEWYGADPRGHHQAIHVWKKPPARRVDSSNYTGMGARFLDGRWHTFGAQKVEDQLIFYMDRVEVSRVKVGPEFDAPLYPLVSLAIHEKDIASAPPEMHLDVDYIRAYGPAR